MGIKKDIPSARFVYLYRDPRDQVASWLRTPVHLHTPYAAIQKWKLEQDQCLHLLHFYGLDMFLVKYEDLISNTESFSSNLLNYLDMPV